MKRLLTSCFGLGWLPLAPGTWGSLPPMITFALICHFAVSTLVISIIMTVLALAGSVVCVKCAPAIVAATGKTDPGEIVVDEFAGQALTFLIVTAVTGPSWADGPVWAIAAGGFLLFRVFDIAKPWPIRKFERLPKGWGVLADDLIAAVYAAIGLLICVRLLG
ncbi:MAG: phosphatidylglycerophosphatase A [Sedimentisphaerales bacterium]